MVRVPDLSGNGAALFCKFVKLTWRALGNQGVQCIHTLEHTHIHTYKITHINSLKQNC